MAKSTANGIHTTQRAAKAFIPLPSPQAMTRRRNASFLRLPLLPRQTSFMCRKQGDLKLLEAKHITRAREFAIVPVRVPCFPGWALWSTIKKTYPLSEGQCLWIDCRKEHRYFSNPAHPWELRWVHFDGHNADRFYRLYADRFAPVITSGHFQAINRILIELIATNYRQTLEAELESHQLLTTACDAAPCTRTGGSNWKDVCGSSIPVRTLP